MIPIQLRLRNFLCYVEPDAPLDFSGFRLACLAGDNGHGKSALLDAITWALWGKARAKRDDELIHQGQAEMEVEFDFELAGQRYRVLRKRSSRGSGQSLLEFQMDMGDGYRALTGETIRATQQRITDVLRMDYDTFVNSAFLMQGRADEFTVKAPGERKRVLSEILGLSYYDQLEERAKEQAKAVQSSLDEVAGQVREMEREIARRPDYEAEAAGLSTQVAQAEERRVRANAEVETASREVQALLARADELGQVKGRIERAESAARQLRAQLDESARRLDAYRAVIAQRPEIERDSAELQAAVDAERVMSRKVADHIRLSDELKRLDSDLAEARHGVELQRDRAQTALAQAQARAAELPALQSQADIADRELQELSARSEALEQAQAAAHDAETEKAGLAAANTRLKEDMNALKDKLDQLRGAEAICPVCRTPLSPENRQRVLADMQVEGTAAADRFRANSERIRALDTALSRHKADVATLQRALAGQAAVQARAAHASLRAREAQAAAEQVAPLIEQVATLTATLDAGGYAGDARTRRDAVAAEWAAVQYDAAAHTALRKRIEGLRPAEKRRLELEGALAAVDGEQANHQRLGDILAQSQAANAQDRERMGSLEEQARGLPDARTRQARAEQALAEAAAQERTHRDRLAAARQRIDTCCALETERARKLTESRALAEEKSLLEELRLAFGRRGIQAMIIESVIPELRDEANRLLSHMTDGRMQVEFDTQRNTKKGDTVETLDIHISDELGTRPYELYSGGERFRVDFCIRIALSKLLARRAGANLQTLVIDEGFGSQDASGRQRLVEAIQSVQGDFQKVLVITHVEELRDAFPVRINIVKGDKGSQYSID